MPVTLSRAKDLVFILFMLTKGGISQLPQTKRRYFYDVVKEFKNQY